MAYKPRTLDEIRGALALKLATVVKHDAYTVLGGYTTRHDRDTQEHIRDLLDMFTLLQHDALARSDVPAVIAFREAADECREHVDLSRVVVQERQKNRGY